MRYALVGYGRMGRAIEHVAGQAGHELVATLDVRDGERLGRGELTAERLSGAEVALEFTVPSAARANVLGLVRLGVPVVCGTTGWSIDDKTRQVLSEATAGSIVASNFSLGVRLFSRIVRHAGGLVAAARHHRASVFEMHHTGKLDAPSGTARMLAATLREVDPRIEAIVEGNPDGQLPGGALHVASLRVESEPGTHTVAFDGEYDRIELTHRARGRAGFAAGAVAAAEWLIGRRGLHDFEEVIDDLVGGRRG